MNGFSYRDISEPLGVKNAAIYYHFPSKMDLVKALVDENHQSLKRSTAEFMAYGGTALPQLEGLFHYTRTQMELRRPVQGRFHPGHDSGRTPVGANSRHENAGMHLRPDAHGSGRRPGRS